MLKKINIFFAFPIRTWELTAKAGLGVDRIIEVDFAVNVNTDLAVLRPYGEVIVYGSGASEISLPSSPAIRKPIHSYFFIVYKLEPECASGQSPIYPRCWKIIN